MLALQGHVPRERARDERRGTAGSREPEREPTLSRGPRSAGSMSSSDFAELLDEPIKRMLGYAGGELEIGGDEGQIDEKSLCLT